MTNRPLPEPLRRRFKVDTVEEMWRQILTQGNVRTKRWRHVYGRLPADLRCVQCHRPFAGLGGALLRRLQGVHRSDKNPRFCAACQAAQTETAGLESRAAAQGQERAGERESLAGRIGEGCRAQGAAGLRRDPRLA